MPDSLGARLRAHRESRSISLTTVADQTKISASLLDALERDDVSRWPTGLFRRAFVRAYASTIGLDPESTVREFLDAHPDPTEPTAVPVNGVAVALPDEADAPTPTRLRGLVDSAVVSLGRLSPRRRPSESADPTPATPVAPADSPAPRVAPVDSLAESPTENQPPPWNPDVAAAAQVSTEFGRVADVATLAALLGRAAEVLHGSGAIVWMWDAQTARLWPALAHGYADAVLATVPALQRDDDNATAAVFRSARPAIVESGAAATGAVVAPLIGRGGCVGVLAIEMRDRAEQNELVRALVTIFAAQITPLVEQSRSADMTDRRAAG